MDTCKCNTGRADDESTAQLLTCPNQLALKGLRKNTVLSQVKVTPSCTKVKQQVWEGDDNVGEAWTRSVGGRCFEALEVLPDARERCRPDVEFVVSSFTTLLPMESQSDTKRSYAVDHMVFQQVKLGRNVSQTACNDFTTSTGHEDLNSRI